MYNPDPGIWDFQCEGMYQKIPPFRELSNGSISCAIGHIKILELVSQQQENCLIIEDDALLCHDFDYKLKILSNNLSHHNNWDIVFIGGGFAHTVAPTLASVQKKDFGWILKGHPASNTVCSYIVNPISADILAKSLQKFTLPIDFAINYAMKENDMKVWHIQPYLISEGSKTVYESSNPL